MPRKVFVAGEILTASDVNTNLMDQSVMVFDDATARTTAIPTPVEGMVTYLEDVGGAQGLEVFDGSVFTPVAIEPDPPAILQVVSTTKTDTFSTASTSMVDITGLSVSITPSSNTSKMLVMFHTNISPSASSTNTVRVNLVRDSTDIFIGTGGSSVNVSGVTFGDNAIISTKSGTHLDEPATVSALTYKMQMNVSSGTGFLNRAGNNPSFGVASSITVMEVAG